jgi:hypothetical protein
MPIPPSAACREAFSLQRVLAPTPARKEHGSLRSPDAHPEQTATDLWNELVMAATHALLWQKKTTGFSIASLSKVWNDCAAVARSTLSAKKPFKSGGLGLYHINYASYCLFKINTF